MNKHYKLYGPLLLLFSVSFQSTAGVNPIGWQVSSDFPNPVIVGRTYVITYTLTNNMPFPLENALKITSDASPASEFTYNDQCSGMFLASKEPCTVAVTLIPTVSGNISYQMTIGGYSNNKVMLPVLTTVATGTQQNGVVGQATVSLPGSLTVGTAGSYQFTYTNYGQTPATSLTPVVRTNGGGTLSPPITTCGTSITTLNATTPSCTISGTYTPNSTTPATQTVTGTLTFAGASGSPSAPYTFTSLSAPTGGVIVGSLVAPNEFPPIMVAGSYPIEFLFTNTSGNSVTISDRTYTCSTSAGPSCTFTPSSTSGEDNCKAANSPLPAHAACELKGTVTVGAIGSGSNTYTLTAELPYTGTGSPAMVSTMGTEVTALPTQRTITVINQCTFPVWFSFNGAALAGYTDSNCPPGTSAGPSNTCFWNNPPPSSGTYELTASGGTATAIIPAYNYGGTQWSGNISASTLCSGTSCVQADCGNFVTGNPTSCLVGQGFSQPATQAEITMNATAADSYDVEVINGFHIPISMKPVYYNSGGTTIPATWNNYACGTAGEEDGAVSTPNGFGACNWSTSSVKIPSPTNGTGLSSGYYWVAPNGAPCDITSATDQCSTTTTGELCGLSIDRSDNILKPTCGLFYGYWSADQVCSYSGLSSTVNTFFQCSQALPTAPPNPSPTDVYFPANATLYDLMRCKVPTGDVNPLYNSCYLTYSNSYTTGQINTCCGCADWWNVRNNGTLIPSNSNTQSCGTQIDPQWQQNIQPKIQWMKAACPSAYTFPFDDKTSTFGCSNNLPSQPNSVGYIITFCENGNTGLPFGITQDGR